MWIDVTADRHSAWLCGFFPVPAVGLAVGILSITAVGRREALICT